MRKVGLQLLKKRRPGARFGCLLIVVFCGVLTACPVAYLWEGQTWKEKEPSYETRLQINAELRACILDESELPRAEWSKNWPSAFPFYSDPLPVGMLGGLRTIYSPRASSRATSVWHEIQFYDRTRKAESAYKRRRLGFTSRWYRTWEPLDLTDANLSADESRAACSEFVPDSGPGRGDKRCEAKARHGRFISVFTVSVSPRDMTEQEMIGALQAIDRHMIQCVESFADKEWEEK